MQTNRNLRTKIKCKEYENLGTDGDIKSDDFLKSSKGGGGIIFNLKIYIADFGNFKQGFLSVKLIQNSNFRVQGVPYCMNFRKGSKRQLTLTPPLRMVPISGNHVHAFHTIWPSYLLATISIIKNLQYNFPNMRGGQRPSGIFPKIHLIW